MARPYNEQCHKMSLDRKKGSGKLRKLEFRVFYMQCHQVGQESLNSPFGIRNEVECAWIHTFYIHVFVFSFTFKTLTQGLNYNCFLLYFCAVTCEGQIDFIWQDISFVQFTKDSRERSISYHLPTRLPIRVSHDCC